MYLSILVAGFCGGLVRGLVGFIKYQFSYKNAGFNILHFFGMSFLSGVVGITTAAAVNGMGLNFLGGGYTPVFAFVVGYAGGDFIENIFKIIFKENPFSKNENN